MDKAAINFQNAFYNLEGIHYNDRKKNFYKLLNSTDPQTLAHLDIEPRNYLERIFHVDILIKAKNIDKLIEILQEGIGVLTSRVIKQKWFFVEAFKDKSEAQIVNEFLPTLSFSVRMKVLKKMVLVFNEEKNDVIYDNVFKKYGLFIAQQFIFSCSSPKIARILQTDKITLSVAQLKRVLAKDSNLIKIYFEEFEKNNGEPFRNYTFTSYIIWKYPKLYPEFRMYLGAEHFGRRTTKLLLKTNKEGILGAIRYSPKKIHLGVITRKINNFDKEYLHTYFPKKIMYLEEFVGKMNVEKFLSKYPKKNRWDIFSASFKLAYDADILNHIEAIHEDTIKIAQAPVEVKKKWAAFKYKETDDIYYLEYYGVKEAIAILKEKINVTADISTRDNFIEKMIKICGTNKDYKTYEEIVKYISFRFKNDETAPRYRILIEISNWIDYDLSTEGFWKYVNELIEISREKRDDLPFKNMTQYIIFLIKKKLPYEETVDQYFNDAINGEYLGILQFYYFSEEPEIQRFLSIYLATKFVPGLDKQRQRFASILLENIFDFNKQFKHLWLDLNEFPLFTDYYRDIFARKSDTKSIDMTFIKILIWNNYVDFREKPIKVYDTDNQLFEITKSICMRQNFLGCSLFFYPLLDAIKQPRTTEFQNKILEYFFNELLPLHYDCNHHRIVLQHFFENEPEIILKYFDILLPLENGPTIFETETTIFNYGLVKFYSHLGFDEKLINFVKLLVAVQSTHAKKTTYIENLSKLMETQAYVNLMADYMPTSTKIDMNDKEQKSLYEAQCALIKSLVNLDDFTKLIPLLHKFCQEDYLQSRLATLYKTMYRINEKNAVTFVDFLLERAGSARKQSVFFSFEVLPQKVVLGIFNTVASKEKSISAKKVLKYFLKNPEEHLLNMVITSMPFINKNDTKFIEHLVKSISTIPIIKFRPIFFEHVWHFLDALETQKVKVIDYKHSLLDSVNEYNLDFFLSIKDSFCQNFIKKYFFSNDISLLVYGSIPFTIKYLLAYNNDIKFQFVFDSIKNYKSVYWADRDKVYYIFNFYKKTFNMFEENDVAFLNRFKKYWEKVFSYEETFCEHVLLQLMLLYKQNSNIDIFSQELNKYFKELVLKHDSPDINEQLVDSLRRFLSEINIGKYDDTIYRMFADKLLKIEQSDINCYISAHIEDYLFIFE